jgi:hypothetical protein
VQDSWQAKIPRLHVGNVALVRQIRSWLRLVTVKSSALRNRSAFVGKKSRLTAALRFVNAVIASKTRTKALPTIGLLNVPHKLCAILENISFTGDLVKLQCVILARTSSIKTRLDIEQIANPSRHVVLDTSTSSEGRKNLLCACSASLENIKTRRCTDFQHASLNPRAIREQNTLKSLNVPKRGLAHRVRMVNGEAIKPTN